MKKFLNYFLIFSILINYFPILMFAPTDVYANEGEEVPTEIKVVGEIEEKRKLNEKHYLMSDGSITATIYPKDVHYEKDGKLVDIDNTLISDGSNYSNKSNVFKASFSKKIQTNRVLTFTSEGYNIGLFLINAKKVNATVKNSKISNEEFAIDKLSSNIKYVNVLSNTDIEYDVLPNEVKESIILKNSKAINNNLNFSIQTNGLLARVQDKNTIVLYDGKTKQDIFILNAPFMYDAKGEYTDNINLSLTKTKTGYTIKMKLDMNWLKSKARAYPIVVDPTISAARNFNYIQDTYIYNGDTNNTTKHQAHIVRVGNNSFTMTSKTAIRGLVKFTLPELSAGDQVISADFRIYNYQKDAYWTPPTTSIQIDVHKMNKDWTDATARWANLYSSYDSRVTDYFIYKYDTTNVNKENYANITSIVQDWYTTGYNYGLMLKESVEGPVTGRQDISFLSVNTSSAYYNKRPLVTITYRNQNGLEDYQTFHGQNIGRAGSVYTNDYNGNVVLTHYNTSTPGNRFPASIKHVYNSNDRKINIGYGLGFRLNLSQELSLVTISGISYIKYIDEDGTAHYFYKDGTIYKDEDGLNLQISVLNDVYTMTDKSGGQLVFKNYNGTYILKEIYDNINNKITINHSGKLITSVVDASGKTIYLTYTNSILSNIKDTDGRFMYYTYTSNMLTGITYIDGKKASYTYNANGLITSVKNIDNRSASYEYYDAIPYRIKKITEYGSQGTIGKFVNITYGKNYTTFIDNKNNNQNFIFNDYGQTISISDLGSTFDMNNVYGKMYKYSNSTNAVRNKLSFETNLTGVVNNYIKNGSSEYNLTNWSIQNETLSLGNLESVTETSQVGYRSFKVSSTNLQSRVYSLQQDSGLVKGKNYTLSAHVKTSNIVSTTGGALLYITYNDAAGNLVKLYSDPVTGTNNFRKTSLTVNLPVGITNLKYGFGIKDATGIAYFDAVQLEEGSAANDYNLIENGSFSYGMNNWAGTSLTTNDKVVLLNGNNAMQINGSARKNVYQTILVNGKKGDALNLSFWAKTRSKPIYGDTAADVRINIVSTTGVSQWITAYINPASKEWQFVSEELIANHDYKQIDIYLCYYYNVHEIYFDNIMMFKDVKGNSYTYDINGNVISSVDSSNATSKLQYDTKNQISSLVLPTGMSYTYSYNPSIKNQVTKITDLNGYSTNLSYDSFGNSTKTLINSLTTSNYIEKINKYSLDGNYLIESINEVGNSTIYTYNADGSLNNIKNSNGILTNYTYDVSKKITSVSLGNYLNQYTYTNDFLTGINKGGMSYSFIINEFGKPLSVSVAGQNLITNTYLSNDGEKTQSTFGNGQKVNYNYDNQGRTSKIILSNDTYTYNYDYRGNLSYLTSNNYKYNYVYDLADRLITFGSSSGFNGDYYYDSFGNVSKKTYNYGSSYEYMNYTYDNQNKITQFNNDYLTIKYNRDPLYRLTSKDLIVGTKTLSSVITYQGSGTKTSMRPDSITTSGEKISYTYDGVGNVTSISKNAIETNRYYYDSINQLIKEDNLLLNQTIAYIYDSNRNITKKQIFNYKGTNLINEIVYTYDLTWKDKMISYNGLPITYDLIGNPTSYNGNTYTWINGKELATIKNSNYNVSYKYDVDGTRTSKTVNGITTNYELIGSKVVYEKTGTNLIYYLYDEIDNVIGINYNGLTYHYIKNLQNDIIGIVDSNLNVIARYNYDSYGAIISVTDANGNIITDSNHIANINPYRYRSYRYDSETNLYYLQSRYYSPEWGRFISADVIINTYGTLKNTNMFTYTDNNYINTFDSTGEWVDTILDLGSIALSYKDYWDSPSLKTFGFLVSDVALAIMPLFPSTGIARHSAKAVKITNAIDNVSDAKTIGKASLSSDLGKYGEKAVTSITGYPKNTKVIDMFGTPRIPDIKPKDIDYMAEVKNVKYQSLTKQLRDYKNYADLNGLQFDLFVNRTTKLSDPLIDRIGINNIRYFD